MEKGKLIDEEIPVRNLVGMENLIQIAQEIGVGQHDPFGQARRAAGEGEHGEGPLGIDSDRAIEPLRPREER